MPDSLSHDDNVLWRPNQMTLIISYDSPLDCARLSTFLFVWQSLWDHFVYAPSQWETALHWNIVSHWLGAYTKWSPNHTINRHVQFAQTCHIALQFYHEEHFSLIKLLTEKYRVDNWVENNNPNKTDWQRSLGDIESSKSTITMRRTRDNSRGDHSLEWRHNERNGVSNHQPHDCFLSRLFGRKSKVRWIHRWPVNSPHKGPVTRKMFPFGDVIMLRAFGAHHWCLYPAPGFTPRFASAKYMIDFWLDIFYSSFLTKYM